MKCLFLGMSELWEDPQLWEQKVNCLGQKKVEGEETAYKGFSPTLIARQKENHTVLVEWTPDSAVHTLRVTKSGVPRTERGGGENAGFMES